MENQHAIPALSGFLCLNWMFRKKLVPILSFWYKNFNHVFFTAKAAPR